MKKVKDETKQNKRLWNAYHIKLQGYTKDFGVNGNDLVRLPQHIALCCNTYPS